jgi:hypothetical protein
MGKVFQSFSADSASLKRADASLACAPRAACGHRATLGTDPRIAVATPCFDCEGEVLRRSLELSMRTLDVAVDAVLDAVEKMRPHKGNGESSEFPHALVRLNKAIARLRDASGCLVDRRR